MILNIKNIVNFFKTEAQIRAEMTLEEIVPILKQNLVDAKNNDKYVYFRITNFKKTGFEVKTKGIFAFVPFSLMPFKYSLDAWHIIKYELKRASFLAKVEDIDLENDRIILNATVTKFEEFYLTDSQTYKAIILLKYPRFIVVELGHRYNWHHGSLCYLVHFDSPNYLEINYLTDSISDEISLTYIKSAHNWKRITFDKDILPMQNFYHTEEAIKLKYEAMIKNFDYENQQLKEKIEYKNNKIQELNTQLINQTKHKIEKENLIKTLFEKVENIPKTKALKNALKVEQNKNKELTGYVNTLINLMEQKNADKITTMLENLKAKSNNQKEQITSLLNRLKIMETEYNAKLETLLKENEILKKKTN